MLKIFDYIGRFVVKSNSIFRKRPDLHHTCAACSELPSHISTMRGGEVRPGFHYFQNGFSQNQLMVPPPLTLRDSIMTGISQTESARDREREIESKRISEREKERVRQGENERVSKRDKEREREIDSTHDYTYSITSLANAAKCFVFYHVTILAIGTLFVQEILACGNRLRSTHCRELPNLKL